MKHSRRWLSTVGTAATVSALILTGCSTGAGSGSSSAPTGTSTGLTHVTLQLQWFAQAQFAGYYAAVDQGFYKEEGLDVKIAEGGADIVPQDVLASGDADYAISWVPKVLGSIEQGANITDVAQIFQRSATTQISFKDKGITTPADLKGKKVGSWGYGNEWELFAGMQKSGVKVSDISLVQQAFDMTGFLSGDIDAAQAMTYNEYAQVLETKNPKTGQALPAKRPQRDQLEQGGHRDAAGRDLGQHRETLQRQGLPGHDGQVHQGRDQGLDLRQGQPAEGRGHRGRPRVEARHEPPALDDQRGQQAHLAVPGRASG